MSLQLINRSKDLKQLRDEGYDFELRAGYLIVNHIPYVTKPSEVKFGSLVTELTLAGDITAKPKDHVMYFCGEYPCNKDGSEIIKIKHTSSTKQLGDGITVNHSFSSKPVGGYSNFYDKVATYVAIISSPARSINPNVTPKTFPTIAAVEGETVFKYIDTASSRAEIGKLNSAFYNSKIGIVGLGGSGSYILDLVAKTHVEEIHLFDGDQFLSHNAFRAPGAPSAEDLIKKKSKVDYFTDVYSNMHRGIISHNAYIDAENVELLKELDFIFLSIDRGDIKKSIIEKLEEWGIPFIDVGMGVQIVDDSLLGVLRVTASTDKKRDHIKGKNRISFVGTEDDNIYSHNIQIADLNALNASFAVVKWKKIIGFYLDLEKEHHCVYTIDGNNLINEDQIETET